MEVYEKEIVVNKTSNGQLWFTAKVRRIGFLWRGKWKHLEPMMLPSYDEAFKLFKDYK